MDPSRTSLELPGKRSGLGRCKHFFWLGVLFDTVGVAVLFTGVFADLLFYDMLLYLGSIIIFLSLLWWVSWYTGNIELLPEESSRKGFPVPAGPAAECLQQSVSHRFSWSRGAISDIFRMQRRHLRRIPERRRILSMNAASLEDEKKDEDGSERGKDGGGPQDVCRETLGPKPGGDQSLEAAGFPGPEAGGTVTPGVQPVTPPSPLDQPLPSAALASDSPAVALLVSAQPPCTTRSQPLNPADPKTQLRVTHSLTSHLERQPWDLPWTFQTQPPTVSASGSQVVATQVPVMSSQTVEAPVPRIAWESQSLLPTQQTSSTTSLVQDISRSQSAGLLKLSTEEPSLLTQKISQEFPEAQQSISSDSTPESGSENKSQLL